MLQVCKSYVYVNHAVLFISNNNVQYFYGRETKAAIQQKYNKKKR